LPDIGLLQPVDVYVPIIEYVPGVVNNPKFNGELVPPIGLPTAVPLLSWYLTPISEPLRPIETPVLPTQKLPPPVTLNEELGSGLTTTVAVPLIVFVQPVSGLEPTTV